MYTYTLYTLYIQRRYKHMYIHSVIQAYKSVHAMCCRELRAGHTCVHAAGRHTGRSRALCTETQTHSPWLQIHIKVKTFSEPHNLGNGSGTEVWGLLCYLLRSFQDLKGQLPLKIKENVRRWHFMTWAQGRVEMSSVAPTAHKAISTGKEATSFWTLTRS